MLPYRADVVQVYGDRPGAPPGRVGVGSWKPAIAGTLYTGQAPRPDATPIKKSGYYVQDTVFATSQDGVITGSIGKTSEVTWLAP